MIIGPGNAELTGHPDRCGEEKSLTGKSQERGTQEGAGVGAEGAVTETILSGNFAIKER